MPCIPSHHADDEQRAALRERRRTLRREATLAERLLWRMLRARQLADAKVRRQYQCGPYILDFYYPVQRLAIEADGAQHFTDDGRAYDEARAAYLAARGIRVLRFTNREILEEKEHVLQMIAHALAAISNADDMRHDTCPSPLFQ